MKKMMLAVLSRMLLLSFKILARLSDPVLVSFLKKLESLMQISGGNEAVVLPIRELREIAQNDPPGLAAIRDIILAARKEQFISLLRGMLKHHIFAKQTAKTPALKKMIAGRMITIGIFGAAPEATILKRAYEQIDGVLVKSMADPDRAETLVPQFNALEITAGFEGISEVAAVAFEKKIPVSLSHSGLTTPSQVRQFFTIAGQNRTPLRIFYPYLYFSPYSTTRWLLKSNLLGEIATIRIKATLAGKGGEIAAVKPEQTFYLNHPAFDHFLLLPYLGGAVDKMTAYCNPMLEIKGGQALINCKFKQPGRYGLLDCSYAPAMFIRSKLYPYDLEVEIAGSDGIIWLNKGMAERTFQAPIQVRVGQQAFSYGVESGMQTDFSSAYQVAAAEFALIAHGHPYHPVLEADEIISTYELRARVYEASDSQDVIQL
ncbi:hypothetical protein ACFL27_10770 [candidate division CSSED10-310 bacterium]|uniref:Gfo/Idh/MocA-like oxidoreductase N-terminal domain-containing protein n=1 Tax=candidate division CSSED10-310 bacterium TaxID=2855610 RepID=A0ABV6YWW2_UNCC1